MGSVTRSELRLPVELYEHCEAEAKLRKESDPGASLNSVYVDALRRGIQQIEQERRTKER